ncbi:unnamed protein product [Adineta ricciae]|uniref:Uncharacterized protein n=1 Tax=Adineta ricciae TaxID=249248 RepID=A0A814W8J7_ADIRI|nr:unnamed protein product [Adineta ricciae]CAF1409942.1 unnamed protein product [Adineta ricciae]
MFFLVSFLSLLPASFLFFLAALSPNWLTFTKLYPTGNVIVQRGLFFICYVISSNGTHETTRCVSMIHQKESTEPDRWIHGFALGAASMAMICIILSLILLLLSGIYFQRRRRSDQHLWYLLSMCLLLFIILGCSISVWILLLSETLGLGTAIDNRLYRWPMWVAILSTMGYLLAFITMFSSFCTLCRRDKTVQTQINRIRDQLRV